MTPPPGLTRSAAYAQRAFHRWYYEAAETTWKNTRWLGVETHKTPGDLWVYQELLAAIRPRWVLETGTLYGGSALYLATVMDALGYGQVLTVDRQWRPGRPAHDRIEYRTADAIAQPTILAVYDRLLSGGDGGPRLVILDSDHRAAHVLAELRAYAPLVTPGSYIVVEDTNLGHAVVPDFGPGPAEAVAEWLGEQHLGFVVARECERLGLTFNPGGYLRRAVE